MYAHVVLRMLHEQVSVPCKCNANSCNVHTCAVYNISESKVHHGLCIPLEQISMSMMSKMHMFEDIVVFCGAVA